MGQIRKCESQSVGEAGSAPTGAPHPSIRDLGLSDAIEQGECAALAAGKLVEPALPRRLVRPPAQQCGAVPEPAFGHMVEADFDDEFGAERLPFAGALGAPAAG